MVPLQHSHYPQSHPMPPHSNPPLPPASVSKIMMHHNNESYDLNRMRQHRMQLEHAQAQVGHAQVQAQADRDRLKGIPVVWRWVPSNAPRPLPLSTSKPRVICATAKRIENNDSENFSLMLTGGELREAREVLIRNNADSLVSSVKVPSTSTLRLPEVPTMMSRHADLARQSRHGKDGDTSKPAASQGGRGDLEVANLLLNMGGTSSDETPSSKNNKTSSDNTSGSNNQSNRSTAAASKPQVLQDIYLENWIGGSVSLHTPEDDDVLSPLHCFMRRYCVEAFSATAEDVAIPRYGKSHGFKVEIGQVGIRCLHCKMCAPGKRAERAVCYPSSLRNIYHSIETWQRRHSLVCKKITPWVRKSIMELMESSKTRAGGRRQYWEDSARRLGMVDTSRGVRFSRKPGDHGPIPSPGSARLLGAPILPPHKPHRVVRADDKDLVTDYLFLLMEQMQTCRFTEEDRTGGRSKIKDNEVGFPGMECRHCQGRAGFGRYFPSSVAALSLANSDRNVYNHLQKCRRCPDQFKTELVRLQKHQSHSKNRRGLRKLFFNRIWNRMHGGDEKDKNKDKDKKREQQNPTPSTQLKSGPEFVPYTGMPRQQLPQLQPSLLVHPYHLNVHTQVAINNFRRY